MNDPADAVVSFLNEHWIHIALGVGGIIVLVIVLTFVKGVM